MHLRTRYIGTSENFRSQTVAPFHRIWGKIDLSSNRQGRGVDRQVSVYKWLFLISENLPWSDLSWVFPLNSDHVSSLCLAKIDAAKILVRV